MHVRWSYWRLQKRMWARPLCRSVYTRPWCFLYALGKSSLFIGIILMCIVCNFNILLIIPSFLESFSGARNTGDFCHCGRYPRGSFHVLPCRCGTHYDAPWCKFLICFQSVLIKFSSFSFLFLFSISW